MSSLLPSPSNGYAVTINFDISAAVWNAALPHLAGRIDVLEEIVAQGYSAAQEAGTAMAEAIIRDSVAPQIADVNATIVDFETRLSVAQDQLAALQNGGVEAVNVPLAPYGMFAPGTDAQEAFGQISDRLDQTETSFSTALQLVNQTLAEGKLDKVDKDGGAIARSINANLVLTSNDKRVQAITATAFNLFVTLPDAMTMVLGGPKFILRNAGSRVFRIKDASGKWIATVKGGASVYLSLEANANAAGQWGVFADGGMPEYFAYPPIHVGQWGGSSGIAHIDFYEPGKLIGIERTGSQSSNHAIIGLEYRDGAIRKKAGGTSGQYTHSVQSPVRVLNHNGQKYFHWIYRDSAGNQSLEYAYLASFDANGNPRFVASGGALLNGQSRTMNIESFYFINQFPGMLVAFYNSSTTFYIYHHSFGATSYQLTLPDNSSSVIALARRKDREALILRSGVTSGSIDPKLQRIVWASDTAAPTVAGSLSIHPVADSGASSGGVLNGGAICCLSDDRCVVVYGSSSNHNANLGKMMKLISFTSGAPNGIVTQTIDLWSEYGITFDNVVNLEKINARTALLTAAAQSSQHSRAYILRFSADGATLEKVTPITELMGEGMRLRGQQTYPGYTIAPATETKPTTVFFEVEDITVTVTSGYETIHAVEILE